VVAAWGCDNSQKQKSLTSEAETAVPESTGPVVSPEIAEAVAEVAQAPTAEADGENAPPENGILSPERANAEAPPGSPPKLTLGKAGDDPKVSLGGPELTDERIGQMTVMVRTGPNSGMPGVAFKFAATGKKPDDGGPHRVSIEVVDASLASEQLGQVPEDIKTAIGTMKGTTLLYSSNQGAISDIAIELGKKTDTRVAALLSAATDALELALLPVPKEPVGAGAFWMVTAREKLSLGDVVGYHLVKVEKIEPGRVTVSVSTKRYLAGGEFQGLPAAQFVGSGTSDLVLSPGNRLPVEGRTQQTMQAVVQRDNGTPRPVMFDLRALLAFPPKGAEGAKMDLAAHSSAAP
jgi:hypothetical protein